MMECHQKEVVEILNYYIIHTTSAYREDTVEEDFASAFLEGPDVYCSFVMKNREDHVIGFCVLEPYRNISTFSEAADVMYFIHSEYTGKGIGGLALKRAEETARGMGIKKLVVDISTENNGSIEFHRKHGFHEYGRIPDIGKKFGRNFGIAYLVKSLL